MFIRCDRFHLTCQTDIRRQRISSSTIATSILTIVHEVELTAEPAFTSMLKAPIRDAELVTSESFYVSELTKAITDVVGIVKNNIEQKKYLRSLCDKVVGWVESGTVAERHVWDHCY
jgi:vacuolar protein sorting-associated protein 53